MKKYFVETRHNSNWPYWLTMYCASRLDDAEHGLTYNVLKNVPEVKKWIDRSCRDAWYGKDLATIRFGSQQDLTAFMLRWS